MSRRASGAKRPLSADERRLWAHVTRHVKPLGPRGSLEDLPPETAEHLPALDTAPDLPKDELGRGSGRSARRAPRRAARGRRELPPQARLDLHGMTRDEAHQALVQFIGRARTHGFRRVLVITGKGLSEESPARPHPREGRGILRRLVPLWLEAEGLGHIVSSASSAPAALGGPGALLVELRLR